MTRKQRRLALIGLVFGVVALAVGLMLFALNDNIVFFNSPSEVVEKNVQPGTHFRLGGLVAEGSVQKGPGDLVRFAVTDGRGTVAVTYSGVLPDLFRESQGVVTEGSLGNDGVFHADTVLAKHDENYMPREVADALKRQGHWNPPGAAPTPPPTAPRAITGSGS